MINEKDIEKIIKENNYKLLGQINVEKEDYEELCEYLRDKLTSQDRYIKTIPEPDLKVSLALVQIAIYHYKEGRYRTSLEEKLKIKASTNRLTQIYQIFMKTLEEYNLFYIKKDEKEINKYVENIKAQAFATNYYIEGLFEFSYDFWENNLFRNLSEDINEDLESLSIFMESTLNNDKDTIESNTKIAKSYKLLKSTRTVFAQLELEELKSIFYPILEMIDTNFNDDSLPIDNEDRFSKLYIEWSKNREEKIDNRILGDKGTRRIYSPKPYIHYDIEKMTAILVIPKQKFRGNECNGAAKAIVKINDNIIEFNLELYMYSGVYISEEKMVLLPDVFDKIEVLISAASDKKYSINNSDYRIFDSNWDSTLKFNKGYNYLLLKPEAEFYTMYNDKIIDKYQYAKFNYFYIMVDNETIYYINGKPLSILGEFSFNPIFENIIDDNKFRVYNHLQNKITITREHPIVSFLVDINKIDGSVLWINSKKILISGIEEKKIYEWEEDKDKVAVSIDLRKILPNKDNYYDVEIDIPGESNKTLAQYMLLAKFDCHFNKKKFIYDSQAILIVKRGDLNVIFKGNEGVSFENNESVQYLITISPNLNYIELELETEIETFTLRIPLKVFLYGFSREKLQSEKLNYIWYADLENLLYIRMPDATKLAACIGNERLGYSEGIEVEPGLFRVDISEIKDIIYNDNKNKVQNIIIEYEDNEKRYLQLPKILRNVYIYPYFKIEHEGEKVFVETKIEGKGQVFLTVKNAGTEQIVIENKTIKNGKNELPELSVDGLYDFYPYMKESDEFGFEEKITSLKSLKNVGCVDFNNLINCKLPIKKIYMEDQKINTGNELYSLKVSSKIESEEGKYIGTLAKTKIEDGKFVPNSFKVIGKVMFVIYEDEELKASIKIYSYSEKIWTDLYFDKQNKNIISGDSKLLDSTTEYDRFDVLEDAEFVINTEKIRRG